MVYLLLRHNVEDYDKWRTVYDQHGSMRKKHGGSQGRVFRNQNNPQEVVLLMKWDTVQNATKFAESDDLKKTMEHAGVMGKPDVLFLDEATSAMGMGLEEISDPSSVST
jgi:heme-degrading monooxygenase HmoA